MFARRCLEVHPIWSNTCVFTRTRNRMNVMCARNVLVNLVVCKATCVFTRTRNRTNVMCARRVFDNLVVCKATFAFIISSAFSCSVIYYSPRCSHIMHRCTVISRGNRRKFPFFFVKSHQSEQNSSSKLKRALTRDKEKRIENLTHTHTRLRAFSRAHVITTRHGIFGPPRERDPPSGRLVRL